MSNDRAYCSSGCSFRDRHITSCECATTHDVDHPGHCKGCLPREATVGAWCDRCFMKTADALQDIPDLVVLVAARRDGKMNAHITPTADPTRHSAGAAPSPSPAWDTADDFINWAYSWCETTADHLRQHGPMKFTPTGVPLPRVQLTAIVTYLRAQLGRIAEAPFAPDFRTEVMQARRILTYFSGHDRLQHRLQAACPTCGMRALVREDGADRVECRNRDCQRVWTESEYSNLAHVAAS